VPRESWQTPPSALEARLAAHSARAWAQERAALVAALRSFTDDPLTFATDPDGDCWLCGYATEPIEEHDEGGCLVTDARAALAAAAEPDSEP
jgi:hypothetical protein